MKILSLFLLTLFAGGVMQAQPLTSRVLVIHNTNSSDSLGVAQFYRTQRGIPTQNVCGVNFPDSDEVTEAQWLGATGVREAIRGCINTVGRTQVLYVVMSYQTPFRLRRNSSAYVSLDSYIADIWDVTSSAMFGGPAGNHRYYMSGAQSAGNLYEPFLTLAAYRLQSRAQVIYSVWRLDAATRALAEGLVTKAITAEAAGLQTGGGTVYLDGRYPDLNVRADFNNESADYELQQVQKMAVSAGLTVVRDTNDPQEFGTAPAPLTAPNAMYYTGWYSLNNYNDVFTWKTGAIGWHLDSSSATSPRSGPSWVPNAIQRGITVTSGAINEPFLNGLPHTDVVFRHLAQGGNVGDAFLRATPWLRWMVMNVGDPLYRPFGAGLAPVNQNLPETTLQITPQSVLGGTINARLTLKDPAGPGGQLVTWDNTRRDHVTALPASTLIPEGSRTANVSMTVHTLVPEAYVLPLVTATAGTTVIANSAAVFSLLNPFSSIQVVRAGTEFTGSITLNNFAPPGGLTIALSSSHSSILQVPASVTIPGGALVALVPVTTTAGSVTENTRVTITATTGIYRSQGLVVVIP
jgi:uncharacterized protein (TIGR03790 family)